MLYKYLFYSVSYLVKKYDRLWDVGDTYYVGGGMTIGMVISLTLINIMDISGAIIYNEILLLRYPWLTYLPLILGLIVTFYLGFKKKHLKIYEEIKNLSDVSKRRLRVINVIHLVLVFIVFFNMKSILAFFDLIQ